MCNETMQRNYGMITPIQYEAKPDDPLMTAAEYARHKGVNRSSVCRMAKHHGVMLNQERKAPLSVWMEADRIGMVLDKNTLAARAAKLPEGSLSGRLAKAKLKSAESDAEIKALELAKLRGHTIEVEEHRARVQGICGLCNRLLDTVADNWAAEVRDPALYGKLKEGIDNGKRLILAEVAS